MVSLPLSFVQNWITITHRLKATHPIFPRTFTWMRYTGGRELFQDRVSECRHLSLPPTLVALLSACVRACPSCPGPDAVQCWSKMCRTDGPLGLNLFT